MAWSEIVKGLIPFFNVKKGEGTKSFLMFLYFFLTITAYYILKPVRDSLFIEWMGAENLPFVYLGDALVIGLVVYIYSRFAERLESYLLITFSALFLILNLLVFRWVYAFHWTWVSFAFYIWVGIFSILTVTQFWTCANDIFDPREAKRLFGLIGSGGILGGITGGVITSRIARIVGTENLIFISALILGVCVIVMNVVWRLEMQKGRLKEQVELEKKATREVKAAFSARTFALIRGSRYLLLVIALVFLMKSIATIIDYQFKNIVQHSLLAKDARTAFFGGFYAVLNTASLVVQLFLTGPVLKRFGVGVALVLLPVGLLMGSAAILLYPVLLSACMLKISDGSLRYSINQSAKEFLYLPVRRLIRYKVKPFIDMFVYRGAEAGGAILLLITTRMLGFKEHTISFVTIPLIAVWIGVIWFLRKEHVKEIKGFLAAEVVGEQAHVKHEEIGDELEKLPSFSEQGFLEKMELLIQSHRDPDDKVCAALLLAYCEGKHELEQLRRVAETMVKYRRSFNNHDALDGSASPQQIADILTKRLRDENDIERSQTIQMLNEMRRVHNHLVIDRSVPRQEILSEIDRYYQTFAVLSLYETQAKRSRVDFKSEDYLSITLQKILDEIIDRIFLLLELLYDPGEIQMIYRKFRQSNETLRANAIELLDHILEQDRILRIKLFPILDGEFSVFHFWREPRLFPTRQHLDERVRVLREGLRGSDRWLGLCAMFVVVKFGIHELFPEIQALVNSSDDLEREAAAFAWKLIQGEDEAVRKGAHSRPSVA